VCSSTVVRNYDDDDDDMIYGDLERLLRMSELPLRLKQTFDEYSCMITWKLFEIGRIYCYSLTGSGIYAFIWNQNW